MAVLIKCDICGKTTPGKPQNFTSWRKVVKDTYEDKKYAVEIHLRAERIGDEPAFKHICPRCAKLAVKALLTGVLWPE